VDYSAFPQRFVLPAFMFSRPWGAVGFIRLPTVSPFFLVHIEDPRNRCILAKDAVPGAA
jgi:hypothetical protein